MLYLSLLQVPEGYEADVLVIKEAGSMAAGYNEGMNSSDARYKIYLHQDVWIKDSLFLYGLLRIFSQDQHIGMIGLIGAPRLADDGIMWHDIRCGCMDSGCEEAGVERVTTGSRDVEVIDGLLMATRTDIPWREDILKAWDFYDVSQSLEFRRAGYKVVVAGWERCPVIHMCGKLNFSKYEENRKIVLSEYTEIGRN